MLFHEFGKQLAKVTQTPKYFKITELFNFEIEKEKSLANLIEIYNKGVSGNYLPRVFFGTITNEQWGMHFYKQC